MKVARRACGMVLSIVVVAAAVAAISTPGASGESGDAPDYQDAREMQRELRALAAAWRDGGGMYGYPFWEKAQQRWRAGEISASVFREYVTGYRDRVSVGCELLDAIDTSTDQSGDVRALVTKACQERREGLREQQRWLDDLIRRDSGELDPQDEDARAALDERIAEREMAANESFESSWRRTREAMDLAQESLEESGFDRLHEDAFI